jgi:ATP-binding cassette subfamily B protein
VEQITRVVAGPLNGFLRQVLIFVSSLAVLGAMDLKLILVTLAVSVSLYYLSKRVSNRNKEYGRLEREQIGKISMAFSDILKNRILVKSYGTEAAEIGRLEGLSDGVLNYRKDQMGYMTRYWSGVEICNCIGYVAAFLVCVYEVKAGHCSIGQVIVVYSYLQRVFSTMVNISRYRTDFFNADAALTRVFALVDREKTHLENVQTGHETIGKVVVSDLTVTYGGRRVVDGLNMELKKGTVTALVAESGKGKSTVIQTLAGFTDISGG